MCGRMTLTQPSLAKVAEELSAAVRPQDQPLYRPRYNVAPSDLHWIAVAPEAAVPRYQCTLVPARWGFRRGESMLVNARGEGLLHPRGALGRALAERRCIVPADGFFEWTGPKKTRQPL